MFIDIRLNKICDLWYSPLSSHFSHWELGSLWKRYTYTRSYIHMILRVYTYTCIQRIKLFNFFKKLSSGLNWKISWTRYTCSPKMFKHAYINNYLNSLLYAKFQSRAHFCVIKLCILDFATFITIALSLLVLIGACLNEPSFRVI